MKSASEVVTVQTRAWGLVIESDTASHIVLERIFSGVYIDTESNAAELMSDALDQCSGGGKDA